MRGLTTSTVLVLLVAAVPVGLAAHAGALDRVREPAHHEDALSDQRRVLGDCTPHPTIRITENQGPRGFILGYDPSSSEPIYRPGSGVTAGTGTAEDPYVIEGWCIVPGELPSWAMAISGTDAHVVIRHNSVDAIDLTNALSGVLVASAANVSFTGNTVSNVTEGLWITSASSGIEVANNSIANLFTGVKVLDSSDVRIANNAFAENRYGVHLEGSSRVGITGNVVGSNDHGILVGSESNQVEVAKNTIIDNDIGVMAYDSLGVAVVNNTIAHNDQGVFPRLTNGVEVVNNMITDNIEGVDVSWSSGIEIAHNTIANNRDGVFLENSYTVGVANNTITNNSNGVFLWAPAGVAVVDNNIHDNQGPGLFVVRGLEVDAWQNWWGDANGPSGSAQDACRGSPASGTGDAIEVLDDASVCFDPWRTEPNPDAGVP